MKYDIVYFVISVHKTAAVFWLRLRIAEEGDYIILMRDLSYRLL